MGPRSPDAPEVFNDEFGEFGESDKSGECDESTA